ncbi:hypothetical protein JCM9957A_11370 [Kineosporia succinea]
MPGIARQALLQHHDGGHGRAEHGQLGDPPATDARAAFDVVGCLLFTLDCHRSVSSSVGDDTLRVNHVAPERKYAAATIPFAWCGSTGVLAIPVGYRGCCCAGGEGFGAGAPGQTGRAGRAGRRARQVGEQARGQTGRQAGEADRQARQAGEAGEAGEAGRRVGRRGRQAGRHVGRRGGRARQAVQAGRRAVQAGGRAVQADEVGASARQQ